MTATGKMTRPAAVKNVGLFFDKSPNSNTVAVDDIFIAAGRDLNREAANRGWLANKLSAMRDYNLVTKIYATVDRRSKLVALKLTSEGKRALGRDVGLVIPAHPVLFDSQPQQSQSTEALLESVNRDIEVLRQKLPSFEIVFDVKPKGVMR